MFDSICADQVRGGSLNGRAPGFQPGGASQAGSIPVPRSITTGDFPAPNIPPLPATYFLCEPTTVSTDEQIATVAFEIWQARQVRLQTTSHDYIALVAYAIWQQRDEPGSADEDWRVAREQLGLTGTPETDWLIAKLKITN